MTFIIQRKVKNAIYVYEGRSYRNKKGKPRNKQRYLGKLDEDGILITRKRKLPARIKEYKRVTKHIILDSQHADTSQAGHTHDIITDCIIQRKMRVGVTGTKRASPGINSVI